MCYAKACVCAYIEWALLITHTHAHVANAGVVKGGWLKQLIGSWDKNSYNLRVNIVVYILKGRYIIWNHQVQPSKSMQTPTPHTVPDIHKPNTYCSACPWDEKIHQAPHLTCIAFVRTAQHLAKPFTKSPSYYTCSASSMHVATPLTMPGGMRPPGQALLASTRFIPRSCMSVCVWVCVSLQALIPKAVWDTVHALSTCAV